MIANKRQINSSRERYVTAITYLIKATRYGISVITSEIKFVKPDKRYCAKQKISTDNKKLPYILKYMRYYSQKLPFANSLSASKIP